MSTQNTELLLKLLEKLDFLEKKLEEHEAVLIALFGVANYNVGKTINKDRGFV